MSTLVTPLPSETAYSCTPNTPVTCSPTAKSGLRDATTRPIAPARMTSPICTGGMYERPSFIQPRIAGSSEMYSTLHEDWPSPGSGTGSST